MPLEYSYRIVCVGIVKDNINGYIAWNFSSNQMVFMKLKLQTLQTIHFSNNSRLKLKIILDNS